MHVSASNSEGRGGIAVVSTRTQAAQSQGRTAQLQDNREVRISLGAHRTGCGDQTKPCRWLSARYTGYTSGRYSVECYWSTSANRLGTRFASFTTTISNSSDTTLCWYNGTPGRHLTALIDGIASNTITFAGNPERDTPTNNQNNELPPTMDEVEAGQTVQPAVPSAPTDLRVTLSRVGAEVSWDPPSGSAPVDSYTVTYSRPELSSPPPSISSWTEQYRVGGQTLAHENRFRRRDVTYTVKVVAHNGAGSSPPAVGEFTSLGEYAHTPVTNIPEMKDSEKDEVPQEYSPPRGRWNKKGHDGGTGGQCRSYGPVRQNCDPKDGFWHTRINSDSFAVADTAVYWDDFGGEPMRGVYSVEFFVPKADAKFEDGSDEPFSPTATARYDIFEQRFGSSEWRRVGYFVVDQGEVEGKLDTHYPSLIEDGWYDHINRNTNGDNGLFYAKHYDQTMLGNRFNNGTWELNGKVRIRISGKDGALAADSIKLVQRDLLPIDKQLATARCQLDALAQFKNHKWIDFTISLVLNIGGSIAVTYLTAGIGSSLIAGGVAVKITDTIILTGKIATFFSELQKILKLAGDLSDLYETITAIRAVIELSELTAIQIKESLSGDDAKLYGLYHRKCSQPDGVKWYDRDDPTFALVQAFVDSGYLDYLHPR